MSWWGNKTFEELIDRATSENLPIGSEDLALNLEICDKIKSKEVQPKEAVRLLKKRLNNKNPNVQILTIKLIDICVKNGGDHFLIEVASKEFVDNLVSIVMAPYGTNPEVRSKILSSLQIWGLAFKAKPNLVYMTVTYNRLKSEGLEFPSVESAEASSIMVETSAAPEWTDSDVCMRCRTPFTTFNRKHHCRSCGRTFCSQCSSKNLALPHLGITQEVRVCDGCYSKLSSQANTPPSTNSPPLSRSNTDGMSVSNRSADDIAKQEQEELEKAIALSLEGASQRPKKTVKFSVPVKTNNISNSSTSKTLSPDEDDEDLKAAIVASLKENQNSASYDPREYSLSYSSKNPKEDTLPKQMSKSSSGKPVIPSAPNPFELSSTEVENVRLFSELVERTNMDVQNRGPQVLNPAQIQALYGHVAPLQAKLARSLEIANEQYSMLYGFHEKASQAIKSYDGMLQERLSLYNAPDAHYGGGRSSVYYAAPPQQYSPYPPQPKPVQHEASVNVYPPTAEYRSYYNNNSLQAGHAPPPPVPQSYDNQPSAVANYSMPQAAHLQGPNSLGSQPVQATETIRAPEPAQVSYYNYAAASQAVVPTSQQAAVSYTYASEQQQQLPYIASQPSIQQLQQQSYAPGYSAGSVNQSNAGPYQVYAPSQQSGYHNQPPIPQQTDASQQVSEVPLIEL